MISWSSKEDCLKRGSKHKRTIREFRLDRGRISVGEALTEFHGILTGVPVYEGTDRRLGDEKQS